MKFKFSSVHKDYLSDEIVSSIEVETDRDSLPDVIEEFERFLRGVGFVFDGKLEIMESE